MEIRSTAPAPQRRLRWFVMGAAVGAAIEFAVPWFLRTSYGLNRDDKWVATHDIDFAERWFFAGPGAQSPPFAEF